MPQFAVTGILLDIEGTTSSKQFASNELPAHVYDDVPPALLRWNANGLDVRTYASQSIAEQRMFFRDTEFGDLLKHFGGHYDTSFGPQTQAASYTAIASAFELPPEEILFLSDAVAQLDAARAAGLQTCLCLRPDNADLEPGPRHPTASNFTQLEFA